MRTPNRGIDSVRGPASHLASLVNVLTANQKVVRCTSGLCLPAQRVRVCVFAGPLLVCVPVIADNQCQIYSEQEKKSGEKNITLIGFFHLQTRVTSWRNSIYSRRRVTWQEGRLQLNSITGSRTVRQHLNNTVMEDGERAALRHPA